MKANCTTKGAGLVFKKAEEERLLVENTKLKRQLAEQTAELAIIKKATAYFARNLK